MKQILLLLFFAWGFTSCKDDTQNANPNTSPSSTDGYYTVYLVVNTDYQQLNDSTYIDDSSDVCTITYLKFKNKKWRGNILYGCADSSFNYGCDPLFNIVVYNPISINLNTRPNYIKFKRTPTEYEYWYIRKSNKNFDYLNCP